MCSFPYLPCGLQPLMFRRFALRSDLKFFLLQPIAPLPVEADRRCLFLLRT